MRTLLVMAGRGVETVMTKGAGILNVMTSATPPAFESRMACRSEPGPSSFVLLTTKVAADAPADARRTLATTRGAILVIDRAGPRSDAGLQKGEDIAAPPR
jgi:hypothetical protein